MLLLFDIDGTLMLKASAAHAQALRQAAAEVHGTGPLDGRIATAGRTDPAIARSLLLDAGVDAARIDAGAADVALRTVELYAQLCPADLSAYVAPGAVRTLDALRDDTLALLTGNYAGIAEVKLARAGLGGRFALGAYGSDSEDRTELPDIARARAGDHPRADTVVIGDTPLDVACARAGGVAVVAVTTGPHPAEELTDADAVIGGLTELPAALDQLRSVQ